ncbi:MAG: hypothetical protein ACJ712_02525, partial [Nitrososphaeraceae archaeon]
MKSSHYTSERVYIIGISAVLFVALIIFIPKQNIASAVAISQQQPNIHGSNIYQTQTIVLGNNIKNLVILIPNEGHDDPIVAKDLRVINQPYIPQNAVVNVGTTVVWFNA